MKERATPTLAQYVQCLSEAGIPTYPGTPGTAWTAYLQGSVLRLPTHCTTIPAASEVRSLFHRNKFLVSYLIQPDDQHPANYYLYITDDTTYGQEKLTKAARRDIRLAQRYLQFGELSWNELRVHGTQAFCQTRKRLRLPDDTPEAFNSYILGFEGNPAHLVLGAWLEQHLIAFSVVVCVDKWVEVKSMFSTDAERSYCPSDGMYAYIMNRFLFEEGFKVICNGILSTDEVTGGLHQFKLKTGFQAIPVHREYIVPIWAKPLINRVTLLVGKTVLHLRPSEQRLRKLIKVLEQMV